MKYSHKIEQVCLSLYAELMGFRVMYLYIYISYIYNHDTHMKSKTQNILNLNIWPLVNTVKYVVDLQVCPFVCMYVF